MRCLALSSLLALVACTLPSTSAIALSPRDMSPVPPAPNATDLPPRTNGYVVELHDGASTDDFVAKVRQFVAQNPDGTSSVGYVYRWVINGFSATMAEATLHFVRRQPEVTPASAPFSAAELTIRCTGRDRRVRHLCLNSPLRAGHCVRSTAPPAPSGDHHEPATDGAGRRLHLRRRDPDVHADRQRALEPAADQSEPADG